MGMDGVNTTIIPRHSTPEQYRREITLANDCQPKGCLLNKIPHSPFPLNLISLPYYLFY